MKKVGQKMFNRKFIFLIMCAFNLIASSSVACQICSGDKPSDDEAGILKMYKQKSEFYGRKNRSEVVPTKPVEPECDFTKGNDNCNKVKPK